MKNKNGKYFKILAIICWLLGLIYIAINIFSFKATIDYYVDYGYTASEVIKEMWLNTLIPTLLEPLITSGGIGAILLGISKILDRLSLSDNDISLYDDTNETRAKEYVDFNNE